ncbi:C1 family peptidase [Candidatus Woesearchaeota archaeon]|nr:C1 family peptidase [Candidatus Woesearchaeota archaeon]
MIEYIMNRVTGKLDYSHKLSELFLWYNARYDKARNVGVYAADLIHEVQKRGDCKEPLWSFEDSSSTKYLQIPPPPTYTDGLRQRVLEVRSVTLDPDGWIAALAAGNPIYIGIDTPQNFGGNVRGGYFNDAQWPSRGGHAMVLVGYDSHYPDGKARNEAFKVRNSWGSGWGEQGYIWFPRTLLRELISRHGNVPYVFTGWEKGVPMKHKHRIIGRVVVDIPPFKPITDETGARLYHGDKSGDEDYGFGPFKVGVIAQIKGKLTILHEILVNDPSGRFVLDFEADQSLHEPLTELSKAYPQLKKINFKNLPAGVVVYKRGAKADDKVIYFHIVHFDKSKGGRGGEGMTHPENPNSAIVHSGLDFSGRPIVFMEAQPEEKNVIIPVISDFDEDEHARKTLESIRKFGLKEKAWAEREFTFLEEMLKDVQHKDYPKARRHFITISRAEGKVSRLQNRLEKELVTHIWNLPHPYDTEFKKVGGDLLVINRSIFAATSRQERSLRSLLDTLHAKLKLLEGKKIKDDAKDALRREIDALWTELNTKVQKVIEWVKALVAELEKLEAAKERKK